MVELTVDYEGEDENSKKDYLKESIQNSEDELRKASEAQEDELKQFRLDEFARKNYNSVGAEHARICGNSDTVSEINKLVNDYRMNACEAAINMTPGKLQRGFYRILNKFGLFNPNKIFQKKIDSVEARIAETKNIISNYNQKISEGIVQAKELGREIDKAMNIREELKAQEYSDLFEKREARNKIRIANEAVIERADELNCLETELEQYDGIVKSVSILKKDQTYILQCLKQLKDNANSNSDIAKLSKLGEAYGKI